MKHRPTSHAGFVGNVCTQGNQTAASFAEQGMKCRWDMRTMKTLEARMRNEKEGTDAWCQAKRAWSQMRELEIKIERDKARCQALVAKTKRREKKRQDELPSDLKVSHRTTVAVEETTPSARKITPDQIWHEVLYFTTWVWSGFALEQSPWFVSVLGLFALASYFHFWSKQEDMPIHAVAAFAAMEVCTVVLRRTSLVIFGILSFDFEAVKKGLDYDTK